MQRGTWSMFGTALQGKSFPVVGSFSPPAQNIEVFPYFRAFHKDGNNGVYNREYYSGNGEWNKLLFPYNYIQTHNWAVTQSGGGRCHCGGDESFNDGYSGRFQREHETLFFQDNDQGKVVKHSGENGGQCYATLFKRPHKNKVHNDIENDSD